MNAGLATVRLAGAPSFGRAPLPPPPRAGFAAEHGEAAALRADLEHPRIPSEDFRTHLRVSVVGTGMPDSRQEAPASSGVDLRLYVDISESMGREGLEAARRAAHELVRALGPEDRLAIYTANGVRRVLRVSRPVRDGREAHAVIDSIPSASGRTSGPAPVVPRVSAFRSTPLVLYVTDGVGPAASIPKASRARAIPLIAFVVGDGSTGDLDALDDPSIDVRRVSEPGALAAHMIRALYERRAASAHDVAIELRPARGVEVVRILGPEGEFGGKEIVRIPSLARGESRVFFAELSTGDGSSNEAAPIADVRVAFRDANTGRYRHLEVTAGAYRVDGSDDPVSARDESVRRSLLRARTGEALIAAGKALARGQIDEAGRRLREQRELLYLATRTPCDPDILRDTERLAGHARAIRDSQLQYDGAARRKAAVRMVADGEGRIRR